MVFNIFKKKKSADESQNVKDHYFKLKVREIIQETPDAITVVFDNPEGEKLQYKEGQFLTLICNVNGEKVRRAYSLCTSPCCDEYPAVTVKIVEGGKMSTYLNKTLKIGDVLEIMEPMGHFTTDVISSNKRHIILFGGGSGITPLLSIIKAILHGEHQSILSLVYANRDEKSIIFKDKITSLLEKFPGRLNIVHVLDNAPINWQGPSGLLSPEMLKKILAELPEWKTEQTVYLMCGPEGMMNNVENTLTAFGIAKEKIYKESFVTGTLNKKEKLESSQEVEESLKTHQVTVIYDGEEYKFDVEPGKTILQTALDLEIDLPYSCQSGLCTACRGKCLSGKVKLDEEEGLSQDELNEGYILTCVGHPVSPDVVIEIG
ncbi:MAG: ferredoxin--NADP reductase [Bacteroidota bacterium]|nr:ferredoxin--NADP reductase [Bacteroidota bacterium]